MIPDPVASHSVSPRTVDVDLVLYDFDAACETDVQSGVEAFLNLLLDSAGCRARCRLLEAAGRIAGDCHLPSPNTAADGFAAELRLVEQGRLREAAAAGEIEPTRLAALSRDPVALWKAHLAFCCEAPTDRAAPRSVPARFAGLTDCWVNGRHRELREQLWPWIPDLLEFLKLDAAASGLLWDFLQLRLNQSQGTERGRFRDVLSGWLREFAAAQCAAGHAPVEVEEWRHLALRGAVRLVVDRALPSEPRWMGQYRLAIMAQRNRLTSVDDLLRLRPSGTAENPAVVAAFRRDLFAAVSRRLSDACVLFELN